MERPLATVPVLEISGWTENEEIVSEPSLSLVNSDFKLVAVVETDGEWEDEALWVEPLAISMPAVEDGGVGKVTTLCVGTMLDKDEIHTQP